jgi:CRP-like cAMP-binding protein
MIPPHDPALCDILDAIPFFSGFSYKEVQTLTGFFKHYCVSKNNIIFKEGDPGDFMFIILEGGVEVIKSDNELEYRLSVEGKGKIIGEMALIDGERRSATCVTTENSCFARMDIYAFDDLYQRYPALAFKFLMRITKLISKRLRMASGKLASFIDTEEK